MKTSQRDPRLITVRRGGTLQDREHRLLAAWAADCAAHVLHFFEQSRPGDDRPRQAIAQARAWARSEISMMDARRAACAAHAAARAVSGPAQAAARAAGHAVAVAHMADHELGGAAYAIRPCARRCRTVHPVRPAAGNAAGSARNSPPASGNSCSMTSGCATRNSGPCSMPDPPAAPCRPRIRPDD